MGFFGGDNEPDNRANDLIEQQMRENDIEIEQKRRSLVQTRLEVIKAQGSQQWVTPPSYGNQGTGNRGMGKRMFDAAKAGFGNPLSGNKA